MAKPSAGKAGSQPEKEAIDQAAEKKKKKRFGRK